VEWRTLSDPLDEVRLSDHYPVFARLAYEALAETA